MAGEADLKAKIVIEAQDQATDVIKNLASNMGVMGDQLSRLATIGGGVGLAIAGIGAAVGGIVAVGRGVADTVEQLDNLSARTGVSVESLQVLQRQITAMGGNAESLAGALTFLNRAIATQDPLLKQLGITTTNTEEAFMQLSRAFEGSSNTANQTEVATRLLGRGSAELLAMLPKLASGFDSTKASMTAMGGVMTGDVLEAARKLDEQADQLDSSWANLMTNMKARAVPAALEIVQAFNDMWDAMTGRQKSPVEALDREIQKVTSIIRGLETLHISDAGKGATGVGTQWIDAQLKEMDEKLKSLQEKRAQAIALLNPPRPGEAGFIGPLQPSAIDLAKLNKPTEPTQQEKDIERIRKALVGTGIDATAAYNALQTLGEARFGDEIIKQLEAINGNVREAQQRMEFGIVLGPELPAEMQALNAEIEKMGALFDTDSEKAAQMVEQLKILAEERERQAIISQLEGPPEVTVDTVVKGWQESVDEMLDMANLVDDAFGSLFQNLEQGFANAFAGIVSGTQSAADAIKSIWQSVVNTVISMLARLAALKVFEMILGFVTGGPALNLGGSGSPEDLLNARVIAPIGDTSSLTALNPVAVTLGQPGGVQGGNTFHIHTYDAHSIVQDLVSPSGNLRRAQEQIQVVGAY